MSVPTVSPEFMAAVFEYLASRGIDEATVLEGLGCQSKAQLVKNNRVPLGEYEKLFALGEHLTGDRHFGLNMGVSPFPSTWGLVSHLALCAENALLALTALMKYARLHLDFLRFRVGEKNPDSWVLCAESGAANAPGRHVVEHMFGNIIELSRSEVGYSSVRLRIDFRHGDGGDPSYVERVLNADVNFDCPADLVYVPPDFLRQQSKYGQADLFLATEKLAHRRLMELQGDDRLVNVVRESILEQLPNGLPKIRTVAAAVGMPPRSLQRYLQERNLKYQTLLDEVRRELARQLLDKPEVSLSQVADYLAFNDQSAFQHAFQRWEGVTPGQFRRAGRELVIN